MTGDEAEAIAEGREAWRAAWEALHPFDQGWVEESLRMGEEVRHRRLAPFAVGLARRNRRRSLRDGILLLVGFVAVGSVVGFLVNGSLFAGLAGGSGGMALGFSGLTRALGASSESEAEAANLRIMRKDGG